MTGKRVSTFIKMSILMTAVLCSCGKSYDKLTLAVSNGGTVTGADFFTEYNGYSAQEQSEIKTYDDYYKIVRKLALKQIIYRHALDEGLQNEPDIQTMLTEAQKNIGYEILLKKNVTDKILITEADYAPYRKYYDLYQIVRRIDTLDEKRIARSRSIMADLAKNVKTFEAFQDAAKKYSEDITAADGGYMGQIRRGILDDELDRELGKLSEGQISGIIETNAGLHILYLSKITIRKTEELIADQSIYDDIYTTKKNELESQWYEKLLRSGKLVFNKEALSSGTAADTVVVQYGNDRITKQQIDDHVNQLRQNGAFPEPTQDELERLVENMALNIIISAKVLSPEITDTKEFHQQYEKRRSAILEDQYILRHTAAVPPSDDEILKFYLENKKQLFSFKTDSGKELVQPLGEVKDFIIERITQSDAKNRRHELYRAEIEEGKFKENEKNIKVIMEK